MPKRRKAINQSIKSGSGIQAGRDVLIQDRSETPTDSDPLQQNIVFISYDAKDLSLAMVIRDWLAPCLSSNQRLFVAENPEQIAAGADWIEEIRVSLCNTHTLFVIATPDSILRPWVNIEIGAAWQAQANLVALCCHGLTRDDLPDLLKTRQSYSLDNRENIRLFCSAAFSSLSDRKMPELNIDKMYDAFKKALSE